MSEVKKLRDSSKGFKWKADVWKKCGGLCYISRENVGEMDAHHINPFKKLALNYIENKGTPYEKVFEDKLFDVNNGVLLAPKIHRAYHSKYGKNINEETLKEFKEDWLNENTIRRKYKVTESKIDWLTVYEVEGI